MGGPLSEADWLVECKSSWTYAERPAALARNGERWVIEEIKRMWRSPQGRHFMVTLEDNRRFHLLYHEADDRWLVEAN